MQQINSKYDITNQRFGLLTAVECISGKDSTALWRCKCNCGTEKSVSYRNLIYGKTRSCGCARTLSRKKDLSGQRFGRLVAIAHTEQKKDETYLWRCKCDCGREVLVSAGVLGRGQKQSCGCLAAEAKQKAFIDLTGQRFGRLAVLEKTDKRNSAGSVMWRCRCDCGNETLQSANVLLSGRVVSCGCRKQETDRLRQKLDYVDGTCIQFITNTEKISERNSSGYRGVRSVGNKWQARISFKKKYYSLGTYDNLEEAIRARKKAEGVLFGEFLDWYYETFPDKKQGREELVK